MKDCRAVVFLAGLAACLPGLLLPLCAQNEDWTKKYVKTTVTETVDRNLDGNITGRTVVTDSRMEVRRKVTEVTRVDTNGIVHVVSRKTESFDSLALRAIPIETVIEKPETPGGRLVVTAITTIVKTDDGQVTTYEARDPGRGALTITKRITSSVNDHGQKVLTVETPDKHGRLVVTKTTIQTSR